MKIRKKNEKLILDKKIRNIKFRPGKKKSKTHISEIFLRTVSSFPMESGAVIWWEAIAY